MFCKDCQTEHAERFSGDVREKIEADFVEFLAKAKAHAGDTVYVTVIATIQPVPGSHSLETCLLSNMPMQMAPGIMDMAKDALSHYVEAGAPSGETSIDSGDSTYVFSRDEHYKH